MTKQDQRNLPESMEALPAGAVLDGDALYPHPLRAAHDAWWKARRTLEREIETHGTGDTPEGQAAQRREAKATETILAHLPQTLNEAEPLAHLIWDHFKPGAAEGTPEFEAAMQDPGRRLVLRLWQATTGMSGYPLV
ncbi:hypothetical protein KUV73_21255 [Mameliella alba]|nr:hypothetical protein [Mameliella alba]MBY6171685.1 hypothetical protein [Mameliella alba]MBY6176910.1 hypothetical protein [Mameliella alba]